MFSRDPKCAKDPVISDHIPVSKDETLNLKDQNDLLGDPEVTANIYCKSRNLPNTDTQNYSTDLRYVLVHPL